MTEKSRSRGFWFSAGLGFLTFVTTPLVSLALGLPLAVASLIWPALNPVALLGRAFHLQDLGGFFIIVLLMAGTIALLGDAVISWTVSRNVRAAVVTFASAFLLQIGMSAWTVSASLRQASIDGRRAVDLDASIEKSFKRIASIRDATYELQLPYDKTVSNPHPELGPMYRNLEFKIPLIVSRPGTYEVEVAYYYSGEKLEGHGRLKPIRQDLSKGEHVVSATFSPWDAGTYGYWSPSQTAGKCQVFLSYLASPADVRSILKADPDTPRDVIREFDRIAGFGRAIGFAAPKVPRPVTTKVTSY